MRVLFFAVLAFVVSFTVGFKLLAALPEGQKAEQIRIDGKSGGYFETGKDFESQDLLGRVSMVVYVAPNQKKLNKPATDAIRACDLDARYFRSYAVVNMRAHRWWPDFFIKREIKLAQEEFPTTTFILDKDKVLVQAWQLADKSSDVVVFDASGKVLFSVDGKLDADQIARLVKTTKEAVNDLKNRAERPAVAA